MLPAFLALCLLPANVATAQRGASTSKPRAGDVLRRAIASRDSIKASGRYDDTFRKYSKRYFGPDFDWKHFKAQAMAESDLNPNARSRVGARGLMQLMPSTYRLIATRRPEFGMINDPEWNIAAGIMHDRYLYTLWQRDVQDPERLRFMFASYNAGEGTIARASATAKQRQLDHARWESIVQVAPTVPRWRYLETLGYVQRIDSNYTGLKARTR